MKPKMTIIKSPRLDEEERVKNGGAPLEPLTLDEMLALLKSKPDQGRGRMKIDNLRRKGLL